MALQHPKPGGKTGTCIMFGTNGALVPFSFVPRDLRHSSRVFRYATPSPAVLQPADSPVLPCNTSVCCPADPCLPLRLSFQLDDLTEDDDSDAEQTPAEDKMQVAEDEEGDEFDSWLLMPPTAIINLVATPATQEGMWPEGAVIDICM